MVLSPHILVGAAIAANTPNLLVGFVLAFMSHFILDRVPHWEYSIEPLKDIKTKGVGYCMPILRRVFADMSTGGFIVLVAVLASRNETSLISAAVGAFFGILPDGMSALYFLSPKNKFLKLFFDLHQKIHFSKQNGHPPLRIGLTWQAVTSILAIYFIIF